MNKEFLYKFTVFTPTYNRADLLSRVYNSLTRQTCKDFEWLVVDDGSTDGTEALVASWISDAIINIRYYRQVNSGKHVAINLGVEKALGELFLIIDSDDYCLDNSLERFNYNWNKINQKERIGISGIFVNCINKKNQIIGTEFPFDFYISDMFDVFYDKRVKGDKWGFFRTDILRQYKFPIFPGENFLTEALVWNRIALKYKTVFVNENLLVVEYQSNGLSAGSLRLRIKNFQGATAYYREFYSLPVPYFFKIKNLVNYIRFSLHGGVGLSKQINDFKGLLARLMILIFFPMGVVFYLKDIKTVKSL